MKKIILTRDAKDGVKLKKKLVSSNQEFSSIRNYTKQDFINNPEKFKETIFIFSTWYMPVFSEEEVKQYFPSLKAIFYAAGTVKYFAYPFFNEGVRVFSAARANAIPVAEFVTAQILLANKGYFQAQKECKKPFWRISFNKARNYTLQKRGNYNAQVGVIGCGSIGSLVVKFLKPYRINICVYDPFLSDERAEELGVKQVSLEDIFTDSDVISNHLPNIPETKSLINWNLLSLMKDNVTFINTGRGEQLVERDLARVMRKKPNACALLDVTIREPLFPWSQLLRRKNIFISPHIAGSLSCEIDRMVEYMVNAYFNTLDGQSNLCEITVEKLSEQA